MKMDFGCSVGNMPPGLVKKIALQADSLGFNCLWGSDHLMAPFAAAQPGYNEAWTMMSYLGAITQRAKLSHMVLVTGFRHPGILANMASTLDHFSEGRLILTTGAGWYQKEFEAFDIPWEKHNERIAKEREAIQIIRSLWTEDVVNFSGRYYRLKNASSEPKPFQKPCPPIWVGGDSRPTMELAAELGDGWLMHGHSPKEVERMVAKITPLLNARSGEFTFATALFIVMGPSQEEADRKLHRKIPQPYYSALMNTPVRREITHRISGPSEECRLQIKHYAEAGIGHLILIFIDPADIDRFATQVLPEFSGAGAD